MERKKQAAGLQLFQGYFDTEAGFMSWCSCRSLENSPSLNRQVTQMLASAKTEVEKRSAERDFWQWSMRSDKPADKLHVLSAVKEGDQIRGIVFSSVNILQNVMQAAQSFGEKNLSVSVDGTYRLHFGECSKFVGFCKEADFAQSHVTFPHF